MNEAFYFVLLVLAVCRDTTATSSHSQISQIDHLPPNLTPLKHDLKIYTEFKNEEDLFHGDVRITVSHKIFYFKFCIATLPEQAMQKFRFIATTTPRISFYIRKNYSYSETK